MGSMSVRVCTEEAAGLFFFFFFSARLLMGRTYLMVREL